MTADSASDRVAAPHGELPGTSLFAARPGPVTQISPDIALYDLARFGGGSQTVLGRIPALPGVYAWYRTLSLPDPLTTSGAVFSEALTTLASAKHAADRTARMAPLYRVTLSSDARFSKGKLRSLEKYCESSSFRIMVSRVLESSLLFQRPLYIGKSANLSQRVQQHLGQDSTLRQRFAAGDADIDRARLVTILLPDVDLEGISTHDADSDDLPAIELMMEELLSRLFHPAFTIRYG